MRLRMVNTTGQLVDVVAGLKDEEELLQDTAYRGRTVGRVANRIRDGKISIGVKTYHMPCNEPHACNHSGKEGWSNRVFTAKQTRFNEVVLTLTDDNSSLPGIVQTTITYTMLDDALCIQIAATCSEITPLNIVNHAYFRIGRTPRMEHRLEVDSTTLVELSEEHLPTGKKVDVAGEALDFTTAKPIDPNRNLCYLFDDSTTLRPMARLIGKEGAITVLSTMPALQVWTPDFGIALEAEYVPGSPVLTQTYKHEVIYRFAAL